MDVAGDATRLLLDRPSDAVLAATSACTTGWGALVGLIAPLCAGIGGSSRTLSTTTTRFSASLRDGYLKDATALATCRRKGVPQQQDPEIGRAIKNYMFAYVMSDAATCSITAESPASGGGPRRGKPEP